VRATEHLTASVHRIKMPCVYVEIVDQLTAEDFIANPKVAILQGGYSPSKRVFRGRGANSFQTIRA
jgi:hypothetical protein